MARVLSMCGAAAVAEPIRRRVQYGVFPAAAAILFLGLKPQCFIDTRGLGSLARNILLELAHDRFALAHK
jgi:hypothetical protein